MKKAKLLLMVLFILCIFTMPALAEGNVIDVGSGLAAVEQNQLAEKVLDIVTGIGYFIGVVAVGALIYSAFQLATGDERKRAEAKTHIFWTLVAVVLVGMALMLVGFVAGLIQ